MYKNLIWDEYINSDIIIFGHDGLLENFGNKKFSFNKFVTFISTYYSIILAKKFLNKKIVIYAGSIGTYSSKLVEFFCSAALKKIDLVTLRDHFSFQYLQKLGITKNIYLTADLAFLMNRISLEKIKKIFIKESIPSDNKMLIGVTVSKELYLFTNTHLNNKEKQFTEYITLKAKVIDYLIKKYDATIMFIPHALKKTKDDRIIARDIYKKIKHKNKVILIENEYSPEELKGIISQCDIFIGERTHSNIAAVSSYVPTICISEPESHRNRGIFGNIIDKQLICDVSKTTFDVYINKIDYLVKNKNEIKKKLFENIEKNKKKSLYNSVLFSLIIDEL